MPGKPSNESIAAQLLLVMMLWGGNNVALKYQVRHWPPVFIASLRFLCAGILVLALMRWSNWLGQPAKLTASEKRRLWTHGAVSLAVYIVIFVWSVSLTSPATVALCMSTSPVWALVWEERLSKHSAHRYFAAMLALAGVLVLFLPGLKSGATAWTGNLLGLAASIAWTAFSRQCRSFGSSMSGLELTGQTFWRAGVILIPIAALELVVRGARWDIGTLVLQLYGILFSGLLAFGLWNHALQVWPTSRAFLFGNLIPVTTMIFSHVCMGEPITANFWLSLALIIAAVLLGQADWRKIISARWSPGE